VAAFAPEVAERLELIPAFGSYRLLQAHPDGFQIHKRTAVGHSWLKAATGRRAAGAGYLGSPAGGVVFGIRNFWQSYPGQLDIEAADTAQARITFWLRVPDAALMDLRPYRDTAGLESYAAQREVLQITYEDPEPGLNSPYGVARTSELELHFPAATPSAEDLQRLAQRIARAGRPTGLVLRLRPRRGGTAQLVRLLGLRRRHAYLRRMAACLAL